MEAISQEYNISLYNLRKLIKEYGIDRIPERKHLVKAFNAHGTGQRVAAHYKVTTTILNNWLESYGLTISKLSNHKPTKIKVYAISEDESVIHGYHSLKEAYEKLGMCQRTIKQYAESGHIYKGYKFEIKDP